VRLADVAAKIAEREAKERAARYAADVVKRAQEAEKAREAEEERKAEVLKE